MGTKSCFNEKKEYRKKTAQKIFIYHQNFECTPAPHTPDVPYPKGGASITTAVGLRTSFPETGILYIYLPSNTAQGKFDPNTGILAGAEFRHLVRVLHKSKSGKYVQTMHDFELN